MMGFLAQSSTPLAAAWQVKHSKGKPKTRGSGFFACLKTRGEPGPLLTPLLTSLLTLDAPIFRKCMPCQLEDCSVCKFLQASAVPELEPIHLQGLDCTLKRLGLS